MTGEIKFSQGEYLKSMRESKVIAAHRAGIKIVIIQKNNKKDLEDYTGDHIKELVFHLYRTKGRGVAAARHKKTPKKRHKTLVVYQQVVGIIETSPMTLLPSVSSSVPLVRIPT